MPEKPEESTFEMIIELPEETMARLDELSLTAQATGGNKIETHAIVRAALEAFFENNSFDIAGVASEAELVERILRSYKKNQ